LAPFDPNQDFKSFLEKFKREFQRVLKLSIELEKKLNEETKEKSVLETYLTTLKDQLSNETETREALEHVTFIDSHYNNNNIHSLFIMISFEMM
jgi:arginine deiminase